MDDLDFEIVSRGLGAPFRPRSIFAGYEHYVAKGHAVLVSVETIKRLRGTAERALPQETGGIVFGRSLRDAEGTYTLVVDTVDAPAEAGGYSTFQLTAEQTRKLKEEGERRHPTCDPIGWWHSHGGVSQYSSVDLANQAMWSEPHHVGLLLFARGRPWGRVYLGPDSVQMRYVQREAAHARPAPADPQSDLQARLSQPPPPAEAPPPPRPPSRQRALGMSRLPPIYRAVGALAVTVIAIIAVGFSGYVNLVSLIEERMPSGTQPKLTWSCQLAGDQANYRCEAESEATGTLVWRIGDDQREGPSISVPRPAAGETTSIELWLISGRHHYKLDSTSLYGPEPPPSRKPGARGQDEGG